MKSLLLVTFAAVSVCFADDSTATHTNAQAVELRTEHHEWQGPHGQIRYRDEVFRGKERVLRTVKFQNEGSTVWVTWRYFYIDGKAVMFESDNGTGKPQTVTLIKDNQTYDQFRRLEDGSLKPLSNDELAKVKAEELETLHAFEKLTDNLAAQLQTNSTGDVTQMMNHAVKDTLHQLHQKTDAANGEDKK